MATFSIGQTGNTRNTARFTRVVRLQNVDGNYYDSTTLTPFPEPTTGCELALDFSCEDNSQYLPLI